MTSHCTCRTPTCAGFTAGKVHLIDAERELVGDKLTPAIFEAGYNLDLFDDEMLRTQGSIGKCGLVLAASTHRTVDAPAAILSGRKAVDIGFGEGTALPVQTTRNGMQTCYDLPIREAAVIYINGQRVGSLWSPPNRLDVRALLKPGRNEIRIYVGNTALNYMSGRRLPDYKLPDLRSGDRFQPQDMDKIAPLPSELIGTVKLTALR